MTSMEGLEYETIVQNGPKKVSDYFFITFLLRFVIKGFVVLVCAAYGRTVGSPIGILCYV